MITNRLSRSTEQYKLPQAEAWGLDTITGLRPEIALRRLRASEIHTQRATGWRTNNSRCLDNDN